MPTPMQQLATIYLGRDVADYIADLRLERVAWQRIAKQLRDDTQGRVDVTGEALRKWARPDTLAASRLRAR